MTVRGRSPFRDEYSEKRWACDCGDPYHALRLNCSIWDGVGDSDSWLSIDSYEHGGSFLDRVKVAWEIIRKGQYCTGSIHFEDTDTMREIAGALNMMANDEDNRGASDDDSG